METVFSRDGTTIAFERSGSGPVLVLVGGALSWRTGPDRLAELLSEHFTVFDYDRRGRGASGDSALHEPEREIEDIDALIGASGGSAALYGMSSGGVLALDAAQQLAGRVTRLALYEPPFIIDTARPPLPDDYVEHLEELVGTGQRGAAVDYFMTAAIGMPEEYLAGMRESPGWAGWESVAHTLAYDGRVVRNVMAGRPLPIDRWDCVTMPTLVMTGELSESFFADGARALVAILPDATHRVLSGQEHNVDADALAPVLVEFASAH
jgi:pimeloyl-ACP methyl ester carboxylesterase